MVLFLLGGFALHPEVIIMLNAMRPTTDPFAMEVLYHMDFEDNEWQFASQSHRTATVTWLGNTNAAEHNLCLCGCFARPKAR